MLKELFAKVCWDRLSGTKYIDKPNPSFPVGDNSKMTVSWYFKVNVRQSAPH